MTVRNTHRVLSIARCLLLAAAVVGFAVVANGGTWEDREGEGSTPVAKTDNFEEGSATDDYRKGDFGATRGSSSSHGWTHVRDTTGFESTNRLANGHAEGSRYRKKVWVACPGEQSPAGSFTVQITGSGLGQANGQYSPAAGGSASNSGQSTSGGGGTGQGIGTPNTATLSGVGADAASGSPGTLTGKGTKVPDQASNGVEATINAVVGQSNDWSRAGNWTVAITPAQATTRPAGTTEIQIASSHQTLVVTSSTAKGFLGASTSGTESEATANADCSFASWN